MKRPFGKPSTTYAQQVELLQQRGMVIDDPTEAEFYPSTSTTTGSAPTGFPSRPIMPRTVSAPVLASPTS